MKYLDCHNIKLSFNDDNQTIDCTYEDKTYYSVKILRCFPLTNPMDYFSINIKENEEYVELGIISKLNELDEESKKALLKDISLRYFLPEILKIKKVITKRRFYNFIVETTSGEKEIRVRDIVYSVFTNSNGDLLIKDADESYYVIKDYKASKDKNVKFIRSFL